MSEFRLKGTMKLMWYLKAVRVNQKHDNSNNKKLWEITLQREILLTYMSLANSLQIYLIFHLTFHITFQCCFSFKVSGTPIEMQQI